MNRTKLRFLFAPIWILNMVFQFGLFYDLLPKVEGQLSVRWMAIICLPFVFFIYLFKDILTFKRVVFLKIIGFIFLVSATIYLYLMIRFHLPYYMILLLPTLFSGFYILKMCKK